MGVAVTSIAKKVLTGHCAGSSWWCRGAAEKSRRCGHIASVTAGHYIVSSPISRLKERGSECA